LADQQRGDDKRLLLHKRLLHFCPYVTVRYGTLRVHFVLERETLRHSKTAAIPR
jgi:hypothetical protein